MSTIINHFQQGQRNDTINLLDRIGSFVSCTNAFLKAKNWTKRIIEFLWKKSSPVDRFWCLRCLNDCLNLPDMIWTIASGANAYLAVKIFLDYCRYKSSPVDRFWCLRCLNYHINLQNMIGSFGSGTYTFLVAKIGTKDLVTSCSANRIWNFGRISMFRVSKWQFDRIICRWCHYLLGAQNWE